MGAKKITMLGCATEVAERIAEAASNNVRAKLKAARVAGADEGALFDLLIDLRHNETRDVLATLPEGDLWALAFGLTEADPTEHGAPFEAPFGDCKTISDAIRTQAYANLHEALCREDFEE